MTDMLLDLEDAPLAATAAAPSATATLRVTLERQALLKALSHIQNVVERRTTIPALANVKLEAQSGTLQLTATDMDMAVTETLAASIEQDGALTVPAHTFYDIVRKLPDGSQVLLYTKEGDEGRLHLVCGSCKFTLPYLAAADFPVMDAGEFTHSFILSPAECKAMVDKTRFAMSTEETRYYLNGIFLHAQEAGEIATLRAVATDGHRLARMEVALPEGAQSMPGVIIPRKAVVELRKLVDEGDEPVVIALSSSKVRFSHGNIVLLSKLVDGTFPDYEKVIPTENSKIMEAARDSFTKAVDRVSTIASEKSRGIKLSLTSGALTLSAVGDGNGTGSEELEVQYASDAIETGFNSRYLLDMMSAIEGDVVQFVLADHVSPAIVRDSADAGALFVLMPMRV